MSAEEGTSSIRCDQGRTWPQWSMVVVSFRRGRARDPHMLIECFHCAAPLDVKKDSWFTTCAYCRRAQRVRSAPSPIATPPRWKPPKVWVPPAQAELGGKELTYDPAAALRKRRLIAIGGGMVPFLFLLAVGGGVAWTLYQHERGLALDDERVEREKTTWDGSKTWSCDGVIEDREVDVSVKVAIASNMDGGCTLRRVKIRGAGQVIATTRGYLAFEDCEIEAGERMLAFVAEGRAKVVIKNTKITLTGHEERFVAFQTKDQAHLTITGSEISVNAGTGLAVMNARDNSAISIVDSKLVVRADPKPSAILLFEVEGNAKPHMKGGSIDGDGVPIVLEGRKLKASVLDGVALGGSEVRVAKP